MYSVAAIVIQTEVRRFLAFNHALDRRWAVSIIQYNYRLYKSKQKYSNHLNRAATTIQAYYRAWVVRDILLVNHYRAIQIQACIRRYLAQKRVEEYWKMIQFNMVPQGKAQFKSKLVFVVI